MNIYVGNLPFAVTESQLQAEFEAFGSVSKVAIITEKETQRPRGFAFVEMGDDSQAKAAIDGLNGRDMAGRSLTVSEARPKVRN